MIFNKVIRGSKRERNDADNLNAILDAGFLCHVAFQSQGRTMMIPTAYGRFENFMYLHGSTKNTMLNQAIDGQGICISVTHLDGIVLAKSLFHTSVNYKSAVLFGKAALVENEEERMRGLKVITDNIIPGRGEEVPTGDENQLKATMVIKFAIESASVKIRNEGPAGDEYLNDPVWSGVIPLSIKAQMPEPDLKFGLALEYSKSVKEYYERNS